jgi:cold shock CspA family protein
MKGQVCQWNRVHGFGFIVESGNFRNKHFFHVTNYKSDVEPTIGLFVLFDIGPSRNEKYSAQAVNVTPVEKPGAITSIVSSGGAM